jgi:hypothetical protein
MADLTTLLVVGRMMVNNKLESIMEGNHRALSELSQQSPGVTDENHGKLRA